MSDINEISIVPSRELAMFMHSGLPCDPERRPENGIDLGQVSVIVLRDLEKLKKRLEGVCEKDRVILDLLDSEYTDFEGNTHPQISPRISTTNGDTIGFVWFCERPVIQALLEAGKDIEAVIDELHMEEPIDRYNAIRLRAYWMPDTPFLPGRIALSDLKKPFSGDIRLDQLNVMGLEQNPDIRKIMPAVHEGDRLTLIREPDNRDNPYAIMLFTREGDKLGYLSQNNNGILSAMMDAGKYLYAVAEDVQLNEDPRWWRADLMAGIYLED